MAKPLTCAFGALSALCALAALACGGGGGASDGSTTPPPVNAISIEFEASSIDSDDEASGDIDIKIVLSATSPLTSAVSVTVRDLGTGTADSGVDYEAFDDVTVTFAAGSTDGDTQTITLEVIDDANDEDDETIHLSLEDLTGDAELGNDDLVTVTITDDDTVTPSAISVAFEEASSDTPDELDATYDITIVLSTAAALATDVTVDVDRTGGTATSGTDFTAFPSTTVTFTAGSTDGDTQTVELNVIGDDDDESGESVILTLSGPTGGAELGGTATHTLIITDDDTAVPVTASVAFDSSSSATPDETADSYDITIVLTASAALTSDVTVDVSRTGGTATSGTDFTAFAAATVTFDAGSLDGATEIVTVSVLGDSTDEPDETVILGLSNPSGATAGTPSTHTLTITDDDAAAPVSFASDVLPLFTVGSQRCNNCHGSSANDGGLRVHTYANLMAGGNSGAAVIANDSVNSLIVKRLEGAILPRMPQGQAAWSAADIQKVKDWIDQGAPNN